MKQVPTDKYSIAWFKLAECIARGEKERALGVYRLLSHSFNDNAYRLQLEGDILFSFDDISAALEKYNQAAQIYKNNNCLLQAAVVYEHMLGIALDQHYFTEIISLYQELSLHDKVLEYECRYIRILIDQNDLFSASTMLKKCDKKDALEMVTLLHEQITLALIKQESVAELIRYHIKQTICGLIMYHDNNALQRFLSCLEQVSELYHMQAIESIEKKL